MSKNSRTIVRDGVTQQVDDEPVDEHKEVIKNDNDFFCITYTQGDELISLNFNSFERRDHELARLRSTGVVCERAGKETPAP